MAEPGAPSLFMAFILEMKNICTAFHKCHMRAPTVSFSLFFLCILFVFFSFSFSLSFPFCVLSFVLFPFSSLCLLFFSLPSFLLLFVFFSLPYLCFLSLSIANLRNCDPFSEQQPRTGLGTLSLPCQSGGTIPSLSEWGHYPFLVRVGALSLPCQSGDTIPSLSEWGHYPFLVRVETLSLPCQSGGTIPIFVSCCPQGLLSCPKLCPLF